MFIKYSSAHQRDDRSQKLFIAGFIVDNPNQPDCPCDLQPRDLRPKTTKLGATKWGSLLNELFSLLSTATGLL
jgi:hypothetical protein